MHLSELKSKHVSELIEFANANEIEGANRMRKHDLIFALLKQQAKKGESIFGGGVLEVLPDGFGFLRSPDTSYLANTDDIYISPSQIRRFNLHTGDTIEGEIRTPKDGERYFALVKVDKVNFEPPENAKSKILFENLTPLFPDKTMVLERDIKAEENITAGSSTSWRRSARASAACWWHRPSPARRSCCSTSRTRSRPTIRTSCSSCCSSTSVPRK
jgi:transcription termination factor Rho